MTKSIIAKASLNNRASEVARVNKLIGDEAWEKKSNLIQDRLEKLKQVRGSLNKINELSKASLAIRP